MIVGVRHDRQRWRMTGQRYYLSNTGLTTSNRGKIVASGLVDLI